MRFLRSKRDRCRYKLRRQRCGGSAGAHSRVGELGIWDILVHDGHVGWRASLRLAVLCMDLGGALSMLQEFERTSCVRVYS